MQARRKLHISAISRKARCGNKTCVKHLKNLAELGIVQEKFHSGIHTFTIKRGDFTELMNQTIKVIEEKKNAF